MQIAFLTLFLGLITGNQQVALDAGGEVAAIELRLDGRDAVRLDAPPWKARIDFGRRLLPHHLEARGLAADGSEVARAEQWINLPRPPAEVEIVLEGRAGEKARTARVAWESLTGEQPERVQLCLDGVPLALDPQWRAPVRVPAEGSAHVLSAELRFAGGLEARKDVVLTGDWGSDVATELTAVPVRGARGKRVRPLSERDLEGRFAAAGNPLRVRIVESEPARVFIVRAPGAISKLLDKFRPSEQTPAYGGFWPDANLHFHFVANAAKLYESLQAMSEIFDISQDMTWPRQALVRLLVSIYFRAELVSPPRLADAVAVAGLFAAAGQTPRAVVLVLANGEAADGSQFDPRTVRGYLDALGVPFFVWALDRRGPANAAWGPVEDVSNPLGLHLAYNRLEREVHAQQIVWLEGRHLPQSIILAKAAGGAPDLELVPRPPPEEGAAGLPR